MHQSSGPSATGLVRETQTSRIPVPTGNCAIIRDAFVHIEGFDESFNKYGFEDSKFLIRARLAGYRVGFYPPMQIKFTPTENVLARSSKLFHSGEAETRMWARHPDVFPDQNRLRTVTKRFAQWTTASARNPRL
ncbi:glycosyltransferase family 2 protein [Neomicrococcus lactis]